MAQIAKTKAEPARCRLRKTKSFRKKDKLELVVRLAKENPWWGAKSQQWVCLGRDDKEFTIPRDVILLIEMPTK
jgi:hypothetical protein